jgi:agmatine/peptidylarginine deiminase
VFLEELQHEVTGHVDMFATFLSPNLVVVAQCSPESDPVNAAILDRNAQRLASLGAPWAPMKVARIPVHRLPDDPWLWFPHTNVVFANGTLLVPVYPGLRSDQSPALALYRQLLPGWKIVGIDADALVPNWGSLHCITLNLPSADKILRAVDRPRPPSQASED